MQDATKSFGDVAGGLSKNPLGIIALFIVLVYGFSSLVTAFGGSLNESEKATLVNFLTYFPVLVLAVFAWLVSYHSNKLYGPSDYRNEENYIRTQFRKEKMPIPIMEEITISDNAFLESITLFFDGEYDEAILNLNKAINKS